MDWLKRLLLVLFFIPQIALAAYTIPLQGTTTSGTIFSFPTPVNGVYPGLAAPFFLATSTTGTSTFSGPVFINAITGIGTPYPSQVNTNADFTVAGTGAAVIVASSTDNSSLSTAILETYAPGVKWYGGSHGSSQTPIRFGLTLGGWAEVAATSTAQGTLSGLVLGTVPSAPLVFGSFNAERARFTAAGGFGVGTTTPFWNLTIASSTGPQMGLSDGTNTSFIWTLRSISNTFYLATSTALATSTTAAFSIAASTGQITIENPLNAILSTNNLGQIVASTSIGSNYITGLPTAANPTAVVGSVAAVNGSATTYMRSDGAPGCTTATALVPGCLSALNWTQFNAKVGTSTADVATQIVSWAGTGQTPATLTSFSGYTSTALLLTATNASTSNFTTGTSTISGTLTVGTTTTSFMGTNGILSIDNGTKPWSALHMVTTTNVANAFQIVNNASTTVFNIDTTNTTGAKWGIGTSSPVADLSVQANNGDTNLLLFQIASSTATATSTLFSVTNAGHIIASSTNPVLSSCGTGPTMKGDDSRGIVTIGSTANGCTITFNVPYSNPPACVVSDQTGSVVNTFSYTVSATAIVMTETSSGGQIINYICEGVLGPQ